MPDEEVYASVNDLERPIGTYLYGRRNDECRLFLGPIVVGGGKRALPDGLRTHLELLDERRFRNGVVHLRYRVGV